MAAITQPSSVRFPCKPETGDHLLQPLRWCGGKWNQLCTIDNDSGPFYKTTQVALRIIPAVVLALAMFFAGTAGVIGSLMKSYSSPSKQDWAGQYIDVAMDAPLKQRCREIGIDNAGLRDWEVSEKISEKLPNLFCSFTVERDFFFGGKTAKIITLATSIYDRNTHSTLYRDLSSCFENTSSPQEKVFSLDSLQHYLLGLGVAPEKQIELSKVIKSTQKIHIAISEDLNNFRITLT